MKLFEDDHMKRYDNGELRDRMRRRRSSSLTGAYQKNNVVTESTYGCSNLPKEELDDMDQQRPTRETREVQERKFQRQLDEYEEEVEEAILYKALENVYLGAIPFDQDGKDQAETTLRNQFNRALNHYGVYDQLKITQAKRLRSPYFIERLQRFSKAFALEKKMEKLTESKKTDVENVDLTFEMDEDDKTKFEEEMDNLGSEEISEFIKEKVVETVKDEQKRQLEEKEELDDLAERTNPEKDENAGDEITVGLDQALEDDSLDDDDDYEDEYDDEDGVEEAKQEEDEDIEDDQVTESMARKMFARTTSGNRIFAHHENESPFKKIMKTLFREAINDQVINNTQSGDGPTVDDIDKDMVFADSISNYTVLETLHTLRLVNFTKEDFKKL